jgi:hypothetical protein
MAESAILPDSAHPLFIPFEVDESGFLCLVTVATDVLIAPAGLSTDIKENWVYP